MYLKVETLERLDFGITMRPSLFTNGFATLNDELQLFWFSNVYRKKRFQSTKPW